MHQELRQLESSLWEAADQLRANSKLNATEYSMPVLGLIFLRHATNRFEQTRSRIQKALPCRGGRTRDIVPEDFEREAAIFLPEDARYDYLANLPEAEDLGGAINQAMRLIEEQVPEQLEGVLPKQYAKFDSDLLSDLVRIFNSDELRNTTSDDIFGRIYEYFLNKFAMSGAQEGGEFFTPPSLVRTIVNFIEPTHGTVLDPACGSGGMFVQAAQAIEAAGNRAAAVATFHGREKSETNTRLARMNLAVHGLEGDIQQGNTFYDRWDGFIGRCDFVMANPPFNVDMVDPQKCKGDPRLFTEKKIPGISSKTKTVSNANYLWIQYFYAYLNEKGRAGFVMAQSATDAGHGEKTVREQIVATRDVDIIMAVGTNFFYTRSLPCSLWFFDKGRPEERRDQILMIDARNVYRVISRKIRDFSEEQLNNLTAITWLYRGQTKRYLELVGAYLDQTAQGVRELRSNFSELSAPLEALGAQFESWNAQFASSPGDTGGQYVELLNEWRQCVDSFQDNRQATLCSLDAWIAEYGVASENTNTEQKERHDSFSTLSLQLTTLRKQLNEVHKITGRCLRLAKKGLPDSSDSGWDAKLARVQQESLDQARSVALEAIQAVQVPYSQVTWLQSRFPDAAITEVPGLCKVVELSEVAEQDFSLTPGRYVGVAPPEPEDEEHVEARLRELHLELSSLNEEAIKLAKSIELNFRELSA